MTDDEGFVPETFDQEESQALDNVEDNEAEKTISIIVASQQVNVRYYENITVKDALKQIDGSPADDKFRILLNGKLATLDTVITDPNTELIFVGEWVLGGKKKD